MRKSIVFTKLGTVKTDDFEYSIDSFFQLMHNGISQDYDRYGIKYDRKNKCYLILYDDTTYVALYGNEILNKESNKEEIIRMLNKLCEIDKKEIDCFKDEETKKKEQEKKEKEEDIKMGEERIKMQLKQDLIREKYYDNIKNYGNKYSVQSDEILQKMKKDQEEEDKKIQFYYDEKNRLAIEREKNEALRRKKEKNELKKYLDMQIEEKKKEEDFLKSLDDEQARIWAIDCKKYHDDEKAIENKIRTMNQKNLQLLREQMNRKNNTNSRTMTDSEYAMNRDLLTKAKASLYKEN
jgi:hypothetical protein